MILSCPESLMSDYPQAHIKSHDIVMSIELTVWLPTGLIIEMLSHLKTEHNDSVKEHKCELCDYVTKRKDHLWSHLKHKHNQYNLKISAIKEFGNLSISNLKISTSSVPYRYRESSKQKRLFSILEFSSTHFSILLIWLEESNSFRKYPRLGNGRIVP